MSEKRKWNDDFVCFGFTCTGNDELQEAQCMLCDVVFSNASMKPSALQQHFNNRHGGSGVEGHDFESLKTKRARFQSQGTLPSDRPQLLASYHVAYKIAKAKEPHTVAEELIKPCLLAMATTFLDQDGRKKLESVPLSSNVIHDLVGDMSDDILDQVISDVRSSSQKISLQLYESADVPYCCQLFALVRYVSDGVVKEDFLFCKELDTISLGEDVYQFVKDFFTKHGLDIQTVGSVCTDGASAMLGNKSGFSALMKREIPHLQVTHCFLHRHALAAETLPSRLKKVLDTCVEIVNWIKGCALNNRILNMFCEDLGDEHEVLLFHTEVCWLSRGHILTCFYELKEEIKNFLGECNHDLVGELESEDFLQMLAYLADIFTRMNELSVSLQGKEINILKCIRKLKAFKGRLTLCRQRVERGDLSNFPTLEDVVDDYGSLIPTVHEEIVAHLEVLSKSFDGYFAAGELKISEEWIMNPYSYNLDHMVDDDELKEDLVDLLTNHTLERQFDSKTLEEYWCSTVNMFPRLGEKALGVLIPFATTCLCESGFSSLLSIQTRSGNRVNPQADLRIAVSSKVPRFDKIIDKKLEQKSH